MAEKRALSGTDGLIEFGNYLNSLQEGGFRDYTFEMPGEGRSLVGCSLNEVIADFQSFFESKKDSFHVLISYVDYKSGTMGSTEKEFRRISK